MEQDHRLETERLVLNSIDEQDWEQVFRLRSDEEMMRYIPRPKCKDREDAIKLIRLIQAGNHKGDSVNWGIRYKDNPKLLGTVGFVRMYPEHNKGELGYMLDKDYFRQGIMQEAVKSVIEFGFDTLGLHRIEAVIDPRNLASEELLKKFGFRKEGHLKENFLFESEYLDSVYYALLKSKS